MYKNIFSFFVFLLIFLASYSGVSSQVNCSTYCSTTFGLTGVCSTVNPSPTTCTYSNFYCGGTPTDLCYCCSSAVPTPTCIPHSQSCTAGISVCCEVEDICYGGYCQIYLSPTPTTPPPTNTPTIPSPTVTPSYSICTGYPGTDPCNQYSCYTGTCQMHGGICYPDGYCYPSYCICGQSNSFCPDDYTCQTTSIPFTCSADDSPIACRPFYINCTGGAGEVPCTDSATCIRECGVDTAFCNYDSICYTPISCGALEEGAGTCLPADNCPDDLERGQIDCIAGEICCAPTANECTGIFDHSGECYFLQCPPELYFEGINPPHEEIGCPLLYACCTQPGDDWIQRNSLNPQCTTATGLVGIRTAVGCIGVTSQTEFLLFVLPWAIGVGGGTAFILIIVAGFLVLTSAGDPQRAKAGKELLGAAFAGLLMIIFSVYILDIIGIRILRLPGL